MALFGRVFLLATTLGLVAVTTFSPACSSESFVREQRAVKVLGKNEIWELSWAAEPSTSFCGPDDLTATMTCGCDGFSYAESGTLYLTRKSGGREIDRINLGEPFASLGVGLGQGQLALQRWPTEEGDYDRESRGESGLAEEIRGRPSVRVLQLADYDHDGSASEMLLQVSAASCGHRGYAAVGVSKSRPSLHFLTSAGQPELPLVMNLKQWEALAKTGKPSSVTEWTCGDHGMLTQGDYVVSAASGVIQVNIREYECNSDGTLGRMIRETVQ